MAEDKSTGNSNNEEWKLEKGNKKEWSKSLEEKHFNLKMEAKKKSFLEVLVEMELVTFSRAVLMKSGVALKIIVVGW